MRLIIRLHFNPSLHMTTTLFLVILCQLWTKTHLLPLSSSPVKRSVASGPSSSELDLLLDPVFQAEQDDQESKKVVPKSVYNTVLRVTSTPCPDGLRRDKLGGPCLPVVVGDGPKLDEEYQLSILKGITSLGGLGSRRPSHNRHKNRHRTTTPLPLTTTTTMEPPTTNYQDLPQPDAEESAINSNSKGNVQVIDIDVDVSKSESLAKKPEFSSSPNILPLPSASSSVTSQKLSVVLPTPQQGQRPTMTTTMPTETEELQPKQKENDATTSTLTSSGDTTVTLTNYSSAFTETVVDPFSGIKAELTTETIIDFITPPTTMISIVDDATINVTFDMNEAEPKHEAKEPFLGAETMEGTVITTTPEPEVPNVMANLSIFPLLTNNNTSQEENSGQVKGQSKIDDESNLNPDPISAQISPIPDEKVVDVLAAGSFTTSTPFANTNPVESVETVSENNTQPSPSPSSQISISDTELAAPVTTLSNQTPNNSHPIPLQSQRVVAQESLASSTPRPRSEKPFNFTGWEENEGIVMTEGNTRTTLPPQANPQESGIVLQTTTPTPISQPIVTSPTPSLIQIDDFEIDPNSNQEKDGEKVSSTEERVMIDGDADVKDKFSSSAANSNGDLIQPTFGLFSTPHTKTQSHTSILIPISHSNPQQTFSPEILNFSPPATSIQPPHLSLAQQILQSLSPPPNLRFADDEMANSNEEWRWRSGAEHHNRRRVVPPNGPEHLSSSGPITFRDSHEQEIPEFEGRRSRNRNRGRKQEDWSPERERMMEGRSETPNSQPFGGGIIVPKLFEGSVDYQRLGNNYRRFRIF